MILLEDSRQQRLKHNLKRDYFREHGILLRKVTLDCGDYTLVNDRSVVIDTKKDIQELISDIHAKKCTKEYIINGVNEIYKKYLIVNYPICDMINIIYSDEVGRYAERDIMEICNKYGIEPDAESEFQKLYVKRHGFFHRGLKRSEYGDVKLYVLVENADGVKSLSDLSLWHNPRLNMKKWITEPSGKRRKVYSYPNATSGETLSKACATMEQRYGVKFMFCAPEEAGKIILELLKVDIK